MTKLQQDAMEKRRVIYNLHGEGKSWEEVAAATGLTWRTCERYYRDSVKRGEFGPKLPSTAGGDMTSIAARDPVSAANIIAAAAVSSLVDEDAKFRDLKEACRAAGMKSSLVTALIKRMQVGTGIGVMQEVKRLSLPDLTAELEKKTALVLGYIDEFSVSQAGLKDLSIAANILIEKHQLLTGKPTHNIDFTSRQELRVLMPALMQEAKRRGITVDSVATRVE